MQFVIHHAKEVDSLRVRRQVMRMDDRQYVMGTGHINCHIDATNHPQVSESEHSRNFKRKNSKLPEVSD